MSDPEYILETDRLRLRPYREDDLDDLAAILGDPIHMRYYPHPFSREESLEWIRRQLARYREDGFGLWVIEERTTGELLGNCGPTVQVVDGNREVELGWHVKRERWGQGIAPEAAAASRDHAFAEFGFEHLIALCRPEKRGVLPRRREDRHDGLEGDRVPRLPPQGVLDRTVFPVAPRPFLVRYASRITSL